MITHAALIARTKRLAHAKLLLLLAALYAVTGSAADLVDTIGKIKPAVVGIGTFIKTRSPAFHLLGSGFAVADGLHIITTAHTYAKPLDSEKFEVAMIVASPTGEPQLREARMVAIDKAHDLALLKISGDPLPVMTLGDSNVLQEGRMLAFTGFPIGMALGARPATHRAMVAALVPVVLPAITATQLSEKLVSRQRVPSYQVIQLDGTAYPGNSGSPLYDPQNGSVLGVLNKVFVQAGRESAIGLPSGITYAIPSMHVRELLRQAKVAGY